MSWPVLKGNSNVFKKSYVSGFLDVNGQTIISQDVSINRLFINNISSDVSFSGINGAKSVEVRNNLTVTGLIQQSPIPLVNNVIYVSGNVIGNTTVDGNLLVYNDISINGRLFAVDDVSINGGLFVNSNVGIGKIPNFKLDVSGSINLSNNIIPTYNNVYGNAPVNNAYISTVTPNTGLARSYSWNKNNIVWTVSSSLNQGEYYSYKAFNNNYFRNTNSFSTPARYNYITGIYPGNYLASTNYPNILNTLYARYTAVNYSSVTNIWYDSTPNLRHIPSSQITGTISVISNSFANGMGSNSVVLQGNTGSRINFTSSKFAPYTFIYVARYNGGTKRRIFASPSQNWLTGFYNGWVGVAHHNAWITNTADVYGNNWVISTDASQLYRGNGVNLTTNGAADTYNGLPPLSINGDPYGETSDWQVADVLIFTSTISSSDYIAVEQYLSGLYGIQISGYTRYNSSVTPLFQSPSQDGEWLQLQSSVPLVLSSYQFASGNDYRQLPKTYYIVASNDAAIWYPIQSASFSTTPTTSNNTLVSSSINANYTGIQSIGSATLTSTSYSTYSTNAYVYFRLIATSIFPSSLYGYFEIGAWVPSFTVSKLSGQSSALMYVDPSNISQLDISGSLAFINPTPSSMNIIPNSANVSGSVWTNNNINWKASDSSQSSGNPLNIPGCFLWLDAMDKSTIIMSSTYVNNVEQWNDKSGYGYNMTQSNTSLQPAHTTSTINNAPAIDLTNGKYMSNTSVAFPNNYSIFAVAYRPGAPVDWGRLLHGPTNGDGHLLFGYYSTVNPPVFGVGVGNGGWVTLTTGGTNTPVNSPCIMEVTNNNTTTGLYLYVNGNGIIGNGGLNGTCNAFTGLTLGIGTLSGSQAQPWNGYVSEILIYNYVVTDAQRQYIEGYLAAKWGLSQNLPITHPYYSISTFTDFNLLGAHSAFRDGTGTCWSNSSTGNYSATTGKTTAANTYTTTVSQRTIYGLMVANVVGEWLQLESSIPLVLNNYYFMTRANAATSYNFQALLPSSWKIVGSNDGSTWYPIQDASCTTLPGLSGSSITQQTTSTYTITTTESSTQNSNAAITGYSTSTNTFSYFRIIIQSILEGTFGVTDTISPYKGQIQMFFFPVFKPVSSVVALSMDNSIPNELNISGSLNINGNLTVNGALNLVNNNYYWIITGGTQNAGSTHYLYPYSKIPYSYIYQSNAPSYYNTSTYTFTAPATGNYLVLVGVFIYTSTSLFLYKNNQYYSFLGGNNAGHVNVSTTFSEVIFMNSGDYIDIRNTGFTSMYFSNCVGASPFHHSVLRIAYLN